MNWSEKKREESRRKERREDEEGKEGGRKERGRKWKRKGRGKVPGHTGKFLGNCLTLSREALLFVVVFTRDERCRFFSSSPAFSTISTLLFTHSDRCVVVAIETLIFIS